ncbi:MAG TPA: hypothetical protein VHN14_03335 [Kofleriaceae bacterium]|jgi:hypothetical protein|nr:hypothetical protein [Kofleriaceae bacterium]
MTTKRAILEHLTADELRGIIAHVELRVQYNEVLADRGLDARPTKMYAFHEGFDGQRNANFGADF